MLIHEFHGLKLRIERNARIIQIRLCLLWWCGSLTKKHSAKKACSSQLPLFPVFKTALKSNFKKSQKSNAKKVLLCLKKFRLLHKLDYVLKCTQSINFPVGTGLPPGWQFKHVKNDVSPSFVIASSQLIHLSPLLRLSYLYISLKRIYSRRNWFTETWFQLGINVWLKTRGLRLYWFQHQKWKSLTRAQTFIDASAHHQRRTARFRLRRLSFKILLGQRGR